jgi:hypothetical protein
MPPDLPSPQSSPPSGAAVAAFLAPVVGLLALGAANLADELTPAAGAPLLAIGSWMPAYRGIGPYAGKVTVMLAGWLGSWVVLHFSLRRRDLAVGPWAMLMTLGLLAAAALVWPPLVDFVLRK